MSLSVISIAILSFSLFETVRMVRRILFQGFSVRSGLLWVGLWLALGTFAVFPDLLNVLVNLSMMQNRLFFGLVVAVIVLFTLVMAQSTRIERLEHKVIRAHQEIAIMNSLLDRGATSAGRDGGARDPGAAE